MAYCLAVSLASGSRTWTVLDGAYATVLPVEDWLEAHRHMWSPNTVRSYATALAQWWTFLEQRGEAERWREVGVPAVTAFLSWLRNGRTVEHAVGAAEASPSAQTLESRRRISSTTSRRSRRGWCSTTATGSGVAAGPSTSPRYRTGWPTRRRRMG